MHTNRHSPQSEGGAFVGLDWDLGRNPAKQALNVVILGETRHQASCNPCATCIACRRSGGRAAVKCRAARLVLDNYAGFGTSTCSSVATRKEFGPTLMPYLPWAPSFGDQ